MNSFDNVSEWSYKRMARFYDLIVFNDEKYEYKLSVIYNLINNNKCEDIKYIAKESGCTYEECIMKIRYLKNKRLIGDLYIDVINGIIKECDEYDQMLLNKYSGYIYNGHMQIDEIAKTIPVKGIKTKEEIKKDILNDLIYLNNKKLLNGVKINEIDGKIIYYSIEKHKHDLDMVTIGCPNCGALKDIDKGSKDRCDYCNSIIDASNYGV